MEDKRRVGERSLRGLDRLAVPLLVIALAVLMLGGHDAVVGARLGQQLLGSLLMLAGVALLVASSLLLLVSISSSNEPAERAAAAARLSVAPVLFLVGAVPGLLLVALQVSAFETRGFDWRFDWRVLLWLVGAIVPLVAAYALWPIRNTEWLGKVPKVIGLLSAAGLIGAGQTVLTSYYKPARRPSLNLTTQLVPDDVVVLPAGKDRRIMQALRSTVSIENTGDYDELLFLGGMYLVTGYNVSSRSLTDAARLSQSIGEELGHSKGPLDRLRGVNPYEGEAKGSPVKAAILYDPGTNWIAAGTKVQLDFLTYVPKNEFQRYIGTALFITARGGRIKLGSGNLVEGRRGDVASKDMPGLTLTTGLIETSWVNSVTRRPLDVSILYGVDSSSPWPLVFPCIHPKNAEVSFQTCRNMSGSPSSRRLIASYGLAVFPAWSSLQMPFPSN